MAIFTHITVGTNNLERARSFYDSVLSALSYKRVADSDGASMWGESAPEFFVVKPVNGEPATVGNGVTVSFLAPTRVAVDEFHKRALAAGGQDAGAPGPRAFAPNAYAAYVRDLDGNKIVAVSLQPA